ncbi:neurotrimin-like isoform X3 [Vespula squamosa]|uniref:Neurotrimin-like isoform X3 n=1 Tax=Vespula squamosa TaxID=30214 RepID=A0ABD2ABF0_VESSQ
MSWCKPSSKNFEDVDYNDDAQADDSEDYSQNDDESDTPDTIEEPPQIKSNPESKRVRSGTTVTLPCLTSNADSFAVVWKKDDEFLYSDDNALTQDKNRIVRTPDNSLVIYNTTVNDTSDNYSCSILSDKPITITHRLLVDPANDRSPSVTTVSSLSTMSTSSSVPIIYVTPSNKVEIKQGQNVTLGCHTKAQPPPTEMKWYHKAKKLHNDKHTMIHGDYITIYKVGRHDVGIYQCLADNGMNNPPHSAINLVVNYAPEIEVEREIVHTGAGVESEITCIVHAHPPANVTWYKNQKELPKRGRISRKENKLRYTLRIMHTSEQDLGEYTCQAKNELGQANRTISLTGAPSQATIYSAEIMRDENDSFILKWHLESYSPITQYILKYRRKGDKEWQEIEPRVIDGQGNQYTVEHSLTDLEDGSYEAILVARNSFGWSQPSAPHTFMRDHNSNESVDDKNSEEAAGGNERIIGRVDPTILGHPSVTPSRLCLQKSVIYEKLFKLPKAYTSRRRGAINNVRTPGRSFIIQIRFIRHPLSLPELSTEKQKTGQYLH